MKASSFYRAEFWRLGLTVARRLSPASCAKLCRGVALLYWTVHRARREVVIQNLLPPLRDDPVAARAVGKQLFQQFALKLADLWRYEAGLPIEGLFQKWTGWEHFVAAQTRNRGVLLLTPHLGNWEFGGPLLVRQGVKLCVITLVEPASGLTELRQASRARWGIETLVIGENPFAFVEVIKRLEAGVTVALLVDRPLGASAVEVELFDRAFLASNSAAELARASGCALLPVYLPRNRAGYEGHILPEVVYDRRALDSREKRRQLTQEILRAFEPVIRQHLDQWYHFVPIWPAAQPSSSSSRPQ
ncbi:MAG: lysophospholipid acyltransferase family protein [Verrucomicrobia bacterium]|nr:lysophospholipid acyltransferase family protein [Verrucomicrobiota bacterium]